MLADMLVILAIITLLMVWTSITGFFVDDFPKAYRRRQCEGRRWKEQFPDVPKDEIRRFLSIFIDAFGFHEKYRLKLSPNDRVIEIYNAVYPPGSMWDGLELNYFFLNFEDTYGVDVFAGYDDDMTLGSLFRTAIEGKGKAKRGG